MALSDKKVAIILPPRDFQDEEYDLTRKVLEFKGVGVKVACTHLGEVRGMKGMTAKVDVLLDDIKTYDYEAFVFIGGTGAREYFEDEKVLKLARDVDHKILGATSNATVILANAGAIKDKKVTSHYSVAGLLRAKGVTYTGQPLQVDEKMVTADSPRMAEQFGNALIQLLREED